MTTHENRLMELIERLEKTLRDLRREVEQRDLDDGRAKPVEAFADELFRSRDS